MSNFAKRLIKIHQAQRFQVILKLPHDTREHLFTNGVSIDGLYAKTIYTIPEIVPTKPSLSPMLYSEKRSRQ